MINNFQITNINVFENNSDKKGAKSEIVKM